MNAEKKSLLDLLAENAVRDGMSPEIIKDSAIAYFLELEIPEEKVLNMAYAIAQKMESIIATQKDSGAADVHT